jgi:hypothetical protein
MKTFSITLISTVLLAIFVARLTMSVESKARILPDLGEEIEVVVCSVTSARTSSLRNSELVSNIVNGLPKDVQVLILVNDRDVFKTKSSNNRVKFIELPEQIGISIWPQDPFIVVNNRQTTRLITPCVFDREDDHVMPTSLGKQLNLEVVRSKLHFEGGNIVCGEEAVLIGVNSILLNSELFNESQDAIEARFEKLLGRPVIVVGDKGQEIPHIDLIITPLGGKRVAVADSRLGATIAQQALEDSPEDVLRFEETCENEFFGRSDVTEIVDKSGNSILRPQVVGQTLRSIEASIAAADQLDQMANQLSREGYQVFRIPALVPDLTPEFDESGREKPGYPFITFNNVLIETNSGAPVVYLPQYGCTALDLAGVDYWKKIGFSVKTIPGFATSAMYGGSLRCCTKVLLRKR